MRATYKAASGCLPGFQASVRSPLGYSPPVMALD